jgi:hypothetical protein
MTVAASPAPTSFVRRHRGKLILLTLLVAAVGGVALWTLATLTFSYSTGDRIGYVQKLSRKGWICRTWEGELAMSPVPGAAPQIFEFTIPDDATATKLTNVEGKRVAIHYEEKRGIPSSCFGDTHYFVTDIREVK